MAVVDPIRVEGLSQLNRALREISAEAPRGLRLAANQAAGLVVDYARAKVPARTGAARSSIRASSTRTAVRVSAGGRRAPYYPWLDYGGRVGPNRSVVRRFEADGRYIYPGYAANRTAIERVLSQALSAVIADAGLAEG